MATRINTKFVIILACVLVTLTAGVVYAVMRWHKTAAEHVAIADKAMRDAEVLFAEGKIEDGNGMLNRSSKNYYAASKLSGGNPEQLYNFIKARNMVICSDLTLAENELRTIISAGAVGIHNMPGATDKDRAYLYETLTDWQRRHPILNSVAPIGQMNQQTAARLKSVPDDPIALRYRAIVESYLVLSETDAEERAKKQELIDSQIALYPEDPWLHVASARYHIYNARRQYLANGNAYSDEVAAGFQQAGVSVDNAIEFSEENPASMIEAMALLMDLHTNKKEDIPAMVSKRVVLMQKVQKMLSDKAMRDRVFPAEIHRIALSMRQIGKGTEAHPFDGQGAAVELSRALIEDRPDDPAGYRLLGMLLRDRNKYAEAEQVISKGLAIKRLTNGLEFVRDQHARFEMLSGQARVKLELAIAKVDDPDGRKKLLAQAQELTNKLKTAQTPNIDIRDARVNYLRGRLELANGRPDKAALWLDKANQTYNGRDESTLRYLAQAHSLLKNTNRVIELYEQVVQLEPNSPVRLNLANLYLAQRDESQLLKAEGHLKVFLTQYPSNLSGIRMLANLFAQRREIDKAVELLNKVDKTKFPEVQEDIDRYLAFAGDTSGIIDRMRERILDRPEGEDMNLALVTQLINILPELEDKNAELDRLVKEGLNKEVARIMSKMISSGKLEFDDEMALLDNQKMQPAQRLIRKSQVCLRYGKSEEAQKYLIEAAKIEPNNPLVIQSRFGIALEERDWPAAQRAVDDILALPVDQRPDLAVADGVFMRAQIAAAQANAMKPGPDRDQKFLNAAVSYTQALEAYPIFAEGWLQLGKIQLVQRNYFGAKNSFTEALSLQNNDIETLENMALAEIGSGELSLALSRYEQILRLRPTHPTALDQFSGLAVQMGASAQAIQMREQMLERRPKDIRNRRALSLLYAGVEQYEKAVAEIEAVIKVQGETLSNVRALSQILMRAQQTEQAIKVVADYIAERGDEADASDHLVFAEAYERADQPENADKQFAKAIELEGDKPVQASQAWASALLSRGDNARALALFEQLSKEQPDNVTLVAQTAQLMIQNNQVEKGAALARKLPDSPERYQLLIQAAQANAESLANAIKQARQGVNSFPDNFRLRLQLGRLLLVQQARDEEDRRNYKEVEQLANKLASDFSDQIEAKMLVADVMIAQQQSDQAIKVLEEVMSFAPTHVGTNERLYNLWMFKARRLAESNPELSQDFAARALNALRDLIEARPQLTALHRNAGVAATLAGQPEIAAQEHGKAFAAAQNEQTLSTFALALVEAGRGREARALLENPDFAEMVLKNLALRGLRGRALAMVGEKEMASALFRNTLNANKDDAQARGTLMIQAASAFTADPDLMTKLVTDVFGDQRLIDVDLLLSSVLLRNLEYAQCAKLLAHYENKEEGTPGQRVDVLLRLALSWQESDQLDKAKATYEKTIAMVKKQEDLVTLTQRVQLLNNLSFLLADQMQGYEKEAVDYAREALEMLPEDQSPETVALIRDTLGWALFKAGRTKEAIKQLERSIAQFPLSANQLHLGKIQLAEGNNDKALILIDAAVKQARADKDASMIAETEKWYAKAQAAGNN